MKHLPGNLCIQNQFHPIFTVEHGKNCEPVAPVEYQKFMQNRKTPVKVLPCSLIVSVSCPYLAATPDGKVIDPGCTQAFDIVEVQCPLPKFDVTPLDACSDSSFCREADNKGKSPILCTSSRKNGRYRCNVVRFCGLYIERNPCPTDPI